MDETAFETAVALHRAGRLAEAEAMYRTLLATDPDDADVLHFLGLIAKQLGRGNEAADMIRRAVELDPDYVEAQFNLGAILAESGLLDGAISCYEKAIQLKPDYVEARFNLGDTLFKSGRFDEAISAFSIAVESRPDYAKAFSSLGHAWIAKGQPGEAIKAYERALALMPDSTDIQNGLGRALGEAGRLHETLVAYRLAIRLKPDFAEAYNNMAVVMVLNGDNLAALAAYKRAIELKPAYVEAHFNLATLLTQIDHLNEAIPSYEAAIRLKPDHADAHFSLGITYEKMGRLDEAIAKYRDTIRIKPDYSAAHSNLIYTLHFHPRYDPEMIHEELQRWNRQHAQPLAKFIQPHPNDPDPDRRLKIGYVSPDFRRHVVGLNLLPLLRCHDHGQFEVFCYASVKHPDAMTEQIRDCADQWRDAIGNSDQALAEQVRNDRIDILIDLSLHTDHNRLPTFAMEPAPVQVTYLGYCGTSGLDTMHYRLSDPYLDPPGADPGFCSEETLRLPETYWCYCPGGEAPDVLPPPLLRNGWVTFGCMNRLAKVSPAALELWCEILAKVPKSRLLIHAPAGRPLESVASQLSRHGIAPDRVEFIGRQTWNDYIQTYHRIDIALDPFPHNGGITTCDALWMGVPVLSLRGKTPVGRGGASILSNLAMTDWIAQTPQQYVSIARTMAGDAPRLAQLRSSLRQRMRQSALMDAPRFARNVENAYRQMWRCWCERRVSS